MPASSEEARRSVPWWQRTQRWMYGDGRPNRMARVLNRISAAQYAGGVLAKRNWVTLEVPGRRTGRPVSVPLVVADYQGARYVVSMLGTEVNWVRNVRATGGRAVLRRRGREVVQLSEVPVAERAPILRRYLDLAPGARAHVPVERGAPLEEFERIADRIPVYRVTRERGDA